MSFLFRKPPTLSLKTPSPQAGRLSNLYAFQKNVGIRFRRVSLLDLAFCHRSYVNENNEDIDNNECLEFLGDSVLGLVVTDYLFRQFSDRPEGDLARIKSYVVSEESLAQLAKQIELDKYVNIGRGEESSGGRKKPALLADCFEAVVGAWYLDAGFEKARRFVLTYLIPAVELVLADKHRKDYKTLLQELVQKRFHSYPQYLLEKKTGPDHNKIFWMMVVVDKQRYGPGKGSNKKRAEQNAAERAYQALTEAD